MSASRNKKWRLALRRAARRLPAIARTSGVVLVTILIVFAAFRVTAPFLISSGLVRTGIEDALSKWTGYRADIEGAPTLEFWPTPRVTLNQIIIREPSQGGRLLGHIDSLSADFSLLSALRGKADFHEFHFLRPIVYLRRNEAGALDFTKQGMLAKAIDTAEHTSSNNTPARNNREDAIGTITVEDGTIELTDESNGRISRLDGINADVDWGHLYGPMNAVMLGRVNGQDIKVEFASGEPLQLFAGKTVDASTSVSSPLLSGSFHGATNILDFAGLAGNLSFSIPNMPAFLAWSGQRLPGAAAIGSISLDSDIATAPGGMHFNNLSFKINDSAATGIMDLGSTAAGKPKISGTLAFDQMNLTPLLAAFSMRLAAETAIDALINGNPLQRLDVDLRLSAKKAALGNFQFDDIGASLLVAGDSAKFDIGDSGFEGGELTAHLEVTERNFDAGGKLQISIRNADFAGLISRLNLPGPLPLSTGSLDLSLGTSKPIWAATLADVSGKMHFSSEQGSFPELNISAFRVLASERKFFHFSNIADTAFDFDKLVFDATFARGSADVHNAKIVGRNETINLAGVVPFRSNALALSGTLDATDAANAAELPVLPFFIGGSWPDPVISPVVTPQPPSAQ